MSNKNRGKCPNCGFGNYYYSYDSSGCHDCGYGHSHAENGLLLADHNKPHSTRDEVIARKKQEKIDSINTNNMIFTFRDGMSKHGIIYILLCDNGENKVWKFTGCKKLVSISTYDGDKWHEQCDDIILSPAKPHDFIIGYLYYRIQNFTITESESVALEFGGFSNSKRDDATIKPSIPETLHIPYYYNINVSAIGQQIQRKLELDYINLYGILQLTAKYFQPTYISFGAKAQ